MNASLMKKCVDDLAKVKSEQNILGALEIYHPEATLITVGLNAEAHGREQIKQQLTVFYALFPDYRVDIKQVACNDQVLLAIGDVYVTPSIPNQDCRTVQQPVSFAFEFKEGRIYREDFFLDFGQLSQKAGISSSQLFEAIQQVLVSMGLSEPLLR